MSAATSGDPGWFGVGVGRLSWSPQVSDLVKQEPLVIDFLGKDQAQRKTDSLVLDPRHSQIALGQR